MAEKLLDLMARECERAYRRGFQQGKWIGSQLSDLAVINWRYMRSLDTAPCPETGKPISDITPRKRLEMESPAVAAHVRLLLRPLRNPSPSPISNSGG